MSESDLSRSLSDSKDPGPNTSFGPSKQSAMHRMTPPADSVDSDDEELAVRQTLEEKFKHISLDPGKQHFIGKSSNLMFIQTAREFQEGSSSEKKSDSSRDQTPFTMPPFFDSAAVRLCLGVNIWRSWMTAVVLPTLSEATPIFFSRQRPPAFVACHLLRRCEHIFSSTASTHLRARHCRRAALARRRLWFGTSSCVRSWRSVLERSASVCGRGAQATGSRLGVVQSGSADDEGHQHETTKPLRPPGGICR